MLSPQSVSSLRSPSSRNRFTSKYFLKNSIFFFNEATQSFSFGGINLVKITEVWNFKLHGDEKHKFGSLDEGVLVFGDAPDEEKARTWKWARNSRHNESKITLEHLLKLLRWSSPAMETICKQFLIILSRNAERVLQRASLWTRRDCVLSARKWLRFLWIRNC